MHNARVRLSGRVYLVTGAGGAIAGSVNRALLAEGASLALADRPGNARRARETLGAGLVVPADLAAFDGARAAVEATVEGLGRLDGVVHTVGGFAGGKVRDASPQDYDRLLDANLRTLVNVTLAALPQLERSDAGFLGAVSAGQAWRGAGPGAALYTASKAALAAFLRSLDGELGSAPTRVGIVYPMGAVDTPANRQSMPDADPGGWIDPDEVGAAFVHLATRSPRGRILELAVHPPRGAPSGPARAAAQSGLH